MISVIYGAKGSGKTKRMIDAANEACEKSSGQVVFITDNNESLGVASGVRFINLHEYNVESEEQFIGFIKGMLATNFDIQQVFIDGLSRLLNKEPEKLVGIFDIMANASDNVKFVVTVSADKMPDFLSKYTK